WLISIADWDFRWQEVYRYERSIVLPKGTTIAMEYVYDNSADNIRNPRHPPGRVVWGQNTTDEMGDLWVQLVPRTAGDYTSLNADVQRKHSTELQVDPDYAPAHNNLAAMLQLAGRTDEAVEHYRRAATLRPDNVEARANLGQLLSARREERAAAAEFRAVLAMREDNPQALAGLAWIEATSTDRSLRNPENAVHLAERAAVATKQHDLTVFDALAAAYAAAGRFDEAVHATE